MISAHERQQEIVSLLSETGRVSVGMLSGHFQVTSETIRRDLRNLEERGVAERVHGGAILPENSSVRGGTWAHRSVATLSDCPSTPELFALANTAARFIQPETRSIFLDAGPAGVTLAGVLATMYEGRNWTVVTTSPEAGIILARAGMPRIRLIGGRFSSMSQSLTGPRAVEMISALRADIAFLCPDGIVDQQGLTSIDNDASSTRRAMLTNSAVTVSLTPVGCLNQHRGTVFGDITEVDVVVTDADINDPTLTLLSAHDLQVVTP